MSDTDRFAEEELEFVEIIRKLKIQQLDDDLKELLKIFYKRGYERGYQQGKSESNVTVPIVPNTPNPFEPNITYLSQEK